MTNYSKFEGKLIRFGKSYPIYNDDDEIIGYTEIGDMAVITYSNLDNDYFETVITSGKYMGVNSLALNLDDIKSSTFIFNKINDNDSIIYIQNKKINFECI